MSRLDPSYYSEMAADYEKKRDMFCAALTEAGLTPYVPEGAYYVLADVSGLGCETARDAAMHILEEAGVASVPGSAFYQSDVGESLTRFCYAKDWDILEQAAERLRRLGG
jgi:aminotransferase